LGVQLQEFARHVPSLPDSAGASRCDFAACPVGGFPSNELQLRDQENVAKWIDTDTLLGVWACTMTQNWKRGCLFLTTRYVGFVDRDGNLRMRTLLSDATVFHSTFPHKDGVEVKSNGSVVATFAGFETNEAGKVVLPCIQAAKKAHAPPTTSTDYDVKVLHPHDVPTDSILKPTQVVYTVVVTHAHCKHTTAHTWQEFTELQSAFPGDETSGTKVWEDMLGMEKYNAKLVHDRAGEMEKWLLQAVCQESVRKDVRVQQFLGLGRED